MNKKTVYVFNLALLLWFFLDMTGFSWNGHLLVSKAFREDGMFFLIFLFVFAAFVFKETVGVYVLTGWLVMWFVTQFSSHWLFTIFGPSEDKIAYFSDTLKLIPSTQVYVPDLYHLILHILILLALSSVLLYLQRLRKEKTHDELSK